MRLLYQWPFPLSLFCFEEGYGPPHFGNFQALFAIFQRSIHQKPFPVLELIHIYTLTLYGQITYIDYRYYGYYNASWDRPNETIIMVPKMPQLRNVIYLLA